MIDEPRDKYYGRTMSEVISQISGELPFDAVGLWQIVPKGRDGFGLQGDGLADFVRRCIHALLSAGAVPVRAGAGTGYEWVMQKQYGSTKTEITENIIREWLEIPNDPIELCCAAPWFARPDPEFPKYVKFD